MKTSIVGPVLLGVLLAAGCQKAKPIILTQEPTTPLASKYPAPVSLYQGSNAVYWAKKAADVEPSTAERGLMALHALKEEGAPFILNILLQTKDPDRMDRCLYWLDGNSLTPEDLEVLTRFLDPSYAVYDEGHGIRNGTLSVFARAGKKGRPLIPKIQPLLNDPVTGKMAKEAIDSIQKAG